jgi:hypothetical protein
VTQGMDGDPLFHIELFQYPSQGPLDGGFRHGSCGLWAFLAAATELGEYPEGISMLFPVIAQCIEGGLG